MNIDSKPGAGTCIQICFPLTLAQNDAAIPIFAMTADACSSDIKKAIDAGMDGHLAKPIHITEIQKVLFEIVK